MKRAIRQEHKSWQIYKKWQKENVGKIREGQEITSLMEFKEIYNEMGRRIRNVQDAVMYQTSYKTFSNLRKTFKELYPDEKVTFDRTMSTQEIAEIMYDDIKRFKSNYIQEHPGASSKQIAAAVSTYFFGS